MMAFNIGNKLILKIPNPIIIPNKIPKNMLVAKEKLNDTRLRGSR